MGPTFYFSRICLRLHARQAPFDDPEAAKGYQTAFDILVHNWDDGEDNMALVGGVRSGSISE